MTCVKEEFDYTYTFTDRWIKLRIPGHLHPAMYTNRMSYFGYIMDRDQKDLLYFRVGGVTPHCLKFSHEDVFQWDGYKFIGQLDTMLDDINKHIKVFFNYNWGFCAEFEYYPDSVNVEEIEEIIQSVEAPSWRPHKWMRSNF